MSLSPDGTKVVFRAATATRDALWIRSLARDDARPLAGDGGRRSTRSGRPTAGGSRFFAGRQAQDARTAAGLPQVIADVPNARGGSWGDDDVILFAPAGGGVICAGARARRHAEAVTRLDTSRGENAHYWPVILPGGRKFLYFVRSIRPENNGIYVAAIDGCGATRLVSSLSSGIYAPPLAGRPGYCCGCKTAICWHSRSIPNAPR